MKSFYFKLFSIFLISGVGILVYSNTFHCSFHFDDHGSIIENSAIKNIHDLQSVWNFLPRRFILYLSIALNYHFNGLNVFGYHLFNLAVHLVTAILVWWLTLLTLSTPAFKENATKSKQPGLLKDGKNAITQRADLIALFAGLIFVSHPIQTQAVTYIVQRAASMATLFYLASLCFYIKSRLLQDNKFYYICSLIAATVAMFTKEIAITLPLMILLYEFSFLKPKKIFSWAQFPFLLTIFIIPLTIHFTESPQAQAMRGVPPDGPPGISSWHYLFTQFRVIATYIRLVFLPLNQNIDYDYFISKSLFELPVLLSLLFLISIFYFTKHLFSKYRLVSFSILWFFLALLPESSIFPIRDVIFEHRLYLPMVGYSIFLVSGAYYLFGKNNTAVMIIILTVIVGGNSFLTYQRNKIWRDEFTLWGDTILKSPHKARPYTSRGKNYFDEGKFEQAMMDFNKAIEVDPKYAAAYNNRGLIYYKRGNFIKAISDYNVAIKIDPNYLEAYNNRGFSYDKVGNFYQAQTDLNKAIEIKPSAAEPYYNRGTIYVKQGDFIQAMLDFNKAIEINPNYVEAYNNRSFIYSSQGNYAQAISDCNEAIKINPNYAEAYNNRGLSYDKQGNAIQAVSDFNQAIGINPNYAEAYYNRGRIYDKKGNFAQAVLDYGKVIKINPKYVRAYCNRGVIYGNQNKLTQAMIDFNKAIELNPQYAPAYSNRAISYYQLKEYDKAWANAKVEELGAAVNPQLLDALKQVSSR